MSVEDTLLPGWETWDTGNYYLPAKNVTLKNGKKGSIIVGDEGVCVYETTIEGLSKAESMGVCFIDMRDTNATIGELDHLLQEEDIRESRIVLQNYREDQGSIFKEDL